VNERQEGELDGRGKAGSCRAGSTHRGETNVFQLCIYLSASGTTGKALATAKDESLRLKLHRGEVTYQEASLDGRHPGLNNCTGRWCMGKKRSRYRD